MFRIKMLLAGHVGYCKEIYSRSEVFNRVDALNSKAIECGSKAVYLPEYIH